jgi:hypothetical protein
VTYGMMWHRRAQVSKGSRMKYEWDSDAGMLRLDRVLHSAVFYPHDYGFIPQTLCDDGDPLDILVRGRLLHTRVCARTDMVGPAPCAASRWHVRVDGRTQTPMHLLHGSLAHGLPVQLCLLMMVPLR